jgi:hypothetical protein
VTRIAVIVPVTRSIRARQLPAIPGNVAQHDRDLAE